MRQNPPKASLHTGSLRVVAGRSGVRKNSDYCLEMRLNSCEFSDNTPTSFLWTVLNEGEGVAGPSVEVRHVNLFRTFRLKLLVHGFLS